MTKRAPLRMRRDHEDAAKEAIKNASPWNCDCHHCMLWRTSLRISIMITAALCGGTEDRLMETLYKDLVEGPDSDSVASILKMIVKESEKAGQGVSDVMRDAIALARGGADYVDGADDEDEEKPA